MIFKLAFSYKKERVKGQVPDSKMNNTQNESGTMIYDLFEEYEQRIHELDEEVAHLKEK